MNLKSEQYIYTNMFLLVQINQTQIVIKLHYLMLTY